jgi:beta-lactamase superfamily II metal-dependent hydrolase
MRRYEALGVAIFQTNRDGAITVTTDGTRIDVRPFIENGASLRGASLP